MSKKNEANVQVIENATLDDGRPGDDITWGRTTKLDGVTTTFRREGIAHHRDGAGDWCTKDGMWITAGEGECVTLTIRRPITEEG